MPHTQPADIIRAQAQVLRDVADEWAANPEAWGDNEKDYRNELRDRADALDAAAMKQQDERSIVADGSLISLNLIEAMPADAEFEADHRQLGSARWRVPADGRGIVHIESGDRFLKSGIIAGTIHDITPAVEGGNL
ncbi:hypothetical protein [Curtobacterium sp. MCBD17_040]|uniref:hypothetical protein n=1 Tax=Curtobacterium sp. MCBD17_040 TaxID=2175674 RepID=UPI000DA8BB22|nr:hypothetical protein [Curtobacterium sp. MCBD17_040]WIB65806.1 hypothetical protein DEI94_16970 [Curtobacterium sp. MCBD17_040]